MDGKTVIITGGNTGEHSLLVCIIAVHFDQKCFSSYAVHLIIRIIFKGAETDTEVTISNMIAGKVTETCESIQDVNIISNKKV
jgi:hypothetical protein